MRRTITEPTISAGVARALMDFAISKGASRATLLERSQLRPEELLDQDGRIPITRYIALMRAGKELCGAPALALEICEATRFERVSIVGLICQAEETMGAAFRQLNRFSRLVQEVDGLGNRARFRITRRDRETWLEDTRPDANRFPELTETTFARFVCETRRHFGALPFVKRIHVTHARPEHAADYERILKAPIVFASEWNAMAIDESWLSIKLHSPNHYAFGIFSERAEALLQRLERSKTTRARVESLMIPLLHTGDLGMERIATTIGVSRQALYRALKAEHTDFETVRDGVRHQMALHYLDGGKVSTSEIAFLVGFSEPSAFSRAFKRWTGASPQRYRTRSR